VRPRGLGLRLIGVRATEAPTDGIEQRPRPAPIKPPTVVPDAADGVDGERVGQRPRMPFAEWLETRLHARRISQRQLAVRSGVDHATVSRLLRDGRVPSLATAAKLVRAVGGAAEPEALSALVGAEDEPTDPICRVELALRSDPDLAEAQVVDLMHRYLEARRRS
jgi:transcriptional regulator with XRE-family HTH domain